MAQKTNRNQGASQGMFGKSLTDPKVRRIGGDADKTSYAGTSTEVLKAAEELIQKLQGNPLPNHTDLASDASTAFYSTLVNQRVNRNAIVGAQDLETMGGLNHERTLKAHRVMLRSICAKNCQKPGRVSCRYCLGAGFEKMSKMEDDPSHNANHSRFELAKGRTSSKV
jgi:hypothetical protein